MVEKRKADKIFKKIRTYERNAIAKVGLTGNILYEIYKHYNEDEKEKLASLKAYRSGFPSKYRKINKRDSFREKIQSIEIELWIFSKYLKKRYAYAIPSEKVLDVIADYSPIIEIGAGKGYWAYHLDKKGVDICCYDIYPRKSYWFQVLKGDCSILKKETRRTLLICYPFGEMAYNCALKYSGTEILYIGDTHYDITADHRFKKYLLEFFNKTYEQKVPTFRSTVEQNYIQVWERTKTTKD